MIPIFSKFLLANSIILYEKSVTIKLEFLSSKVLAKYKAYKPGPHPTSIIEVASLALQCITRVRYPYSENFST